MSDRLYDSFFAATRDVLELMLNAGHVAAEPEGAGNADGGLDVEIAVVGDLTGRVIYHFPTRTALEIVHTLSGMEIASIDDFVVSAVSEIANIISGHVMSEFSHDSVGCDIRPPRVVTLEAEKSEAGEQVSRIRLQTDVGEIGLDIRLRPAHASETRR